MCCSKVFTLKVTHFFLTRSSLLLSQQLSRTGSSSASSRLIKKRMNPEGADGGALQSKESNWTSFSEFQIPTTENEELQNIRQTDDEKDDKGKERNAQLQSLWKSIKKSTNEGGERKKFPPVKFIVKVRNRHLTDLNSVYDCNAWDDVEWDQQMEDKAKEAVEKNSISFVEAEKQEILEKEAHAFWDKFYGIHQNKFFRDRNWLFYEFRELESPFGCSVPPSESEIRIQEKRKLESYPGENSLFKVLEIGCGVGNTVFPLLAANNHPETYVYCCDFSPTAVNIIKNHEKFQSQRCTPFVLDVTDENPVTPFPLGSLDVITSIFVLSAISPEKFEIAAKNLFKFLKPGGLLLFRDYGRYDMAQLRFKDGRCLSDNFYMRGDGTRVYFFLQEEVEKLFSKEGFIKESVHVDKRLQVNRSRQLKMYRVWIQAKFRKPLDDKTQESNNLNSL